MTKQDLSSVLWRERGLLDTLLFKLEVQQLLLTGGRTQWLGAAAGEVEVVLDRIREIEVLRAVELDALAEELGLGDNPSLHRLAEACDETWATIWLDHRVALTASATAISELAESTRELLITDQHATQATLSSLSDDTGTYGADGTGVDNRHAALLDRSL